MYLVIFWKERKQEKKKKTSALGCRNRACHAGVEDGNAVEGVEVNSSLSKLSPKNKYACYMNMLLKP